ncbi:MAG: hypothetical protein ABJB05_07130, partial [Parafilimonas sp.]
KIQTNQMKQREGEAMPAIEKSDAVVVDLNTHKNGHAIEKENNKVLIKKNEQLPKKAKGLRI